MVTYAKVHATDPDVVFLEKEMQAGYVEMYGEPDQDPDNDYRGALGLMVAYDQGHPIGLIGWSLWPNGDGKVRLVYVKPEARGLHVAETLLHWAENSAKAAGATTMRFETGPLQEPAQRLYERCGYTRVPGFGFYEHNPGSVFYSRPL